MLQLSSNIIGANLKMFFQKNKRKLEKNTADMAANDVVEQPYAGDDLAKLELALDDIACGISKLFM